VPSGRFSSGIRRMDASSYIREPVPYPPLRVFDVTQEAASTPSESLSYSHLITLEGLR
jgi:hypothetical protein